jgi:membrane-bound lytic murein transglycosylase D
MPIKKLIFFLAFTFSLIDNTSAIPYCTTDTLILSQKNTDSLLLSIQKEKSVPSSEKVKFIEAYTHDGFRDLFSRFEYLPHIPYAEQINPQAEAFMEDYIRKNKKRLSKIQQDGLIYFNLMESILRQYGLPVELKYLAVIESHLKYNAVSRAGAVGPWQLMPFTAREYGLTVSRYKDERLDYTKSTHAAARILLDIYRDFKDWLLVLAAYNGGKGRVYAAIKKSGSKDFWSLQTKLPEESRNHVKKFIATHYVMESGDPFQLISILQNKDSSSTKSVLEHFVVKGRIREEILVKEIGMTMKEFSELNPAFQIQLFKKGETVLSLMPDKMRLFQEKKDLILQKSVESLLAE